MVSCYLIKQFNNNNNNNNNNNKSINLHCKTHLGNTGGHDKQGIEEVSVRNKLTGILQLRELSLYLWLIALIFIPKYFSLFWLADITSYHWPQFERLVIFLPMTSIGKKIDRKRKSKLKCFCRGQHWGLYISCFGRDRWSSLLTMFFSWRLLFNIKRQNLCFLASVTNFPRIIIKKRGIKHCV